MKVIEYERISPLDGFKWVKFSDIDNNRGSLDFYGALTNIPIKIYL